MSEPTPTQRIEATFGRSLSHNLFNEFEHALRFELADGAEGPGVAPRFLAAMDRARVLARAAFATSTAVSAVVSYYAGERRTRRQMTSLRTLHELGFQPEFSKPERVMLGDEDEIGETGHDLCRYWHMADITGDAGSLDAALWTGVTYDGLAEPRANLEVYLIDFHQGVALYVYDDRGMDVVAVRPEPLKALYHTYGAWLLDYSRARMDAAFSRTN